MNDLKVVLLVVRNTRDLRVPLQTASWISKSTGACLYILFESQLQSEIQRLQDQGEGWFSERIAGHLPHFLRGFLPKWAGHELLMIGALPSFSSDWVLDAETIEIIESLREPVLLFPGDIESKTPWESMITPMSGEARCNRALAQSIELANLLRVPLDIIHVVDPDQIKQHGNIAIGHFGDQAHHELIPMVEEFISEACPYSSSEQKKVIRQFLLVQGEVTQELMKALSNSLAGVLVVEWKGCFMEGHADTLKALLKHLKRPLLLIRQSESLEEEVLKRNRLAS